MRWDRVQHWGRSGGPGPRWGHTCNAVRGGRLVYVFGGYGNHQRRTNQVHVFDTVNLLWHEPVMNGKQPSPRDSHSCTTVGDNLFVFGGTDGTKPLNDLHILDTSTNSWILPSVSSDGPEPREGHSAAVIGKRYFIFGGCGKSENSEIYYDDLYILDTEIFLWVRVTPSGTPPSKRDSHTCSSWKNKIIVIGGEDSSNSYLSDVHELDVDTLVWRKLHTTGQLLPPRGGHTTVGFERNLFVFGGFSDEQNLYDDVYMLDIENATWTKIITIGEGPSGRFSMAGDCLGPQMGGLLVFIGGCNKNLEALDDMYYLHAGLAREIVADERRVEKLSLRKQLKLKCQAQYTVPRTYGKAPSGVERGHDTTLYQPVPISSSMPPGMQNLYLNEFQTQLGKRTFQANVTERVGDGFAIVTVIDGKPFRGVVFSTKPSPTTMGTDIANRKAKARKTVGFKEHSNPKFGFEYKKSLKDPTNNIIKQAEDVQELLKVTELQAEVPASEIKNPTATMLSIPQEGPTNDVIKQADAVQELLEVAEPQVEVTASEIKTPTATMLSMTQEDPTNNIIEQADAVLEESKVAEAQAEVAASEMKNSTVANLSVPQVTTNDVIEQAAAVQEESNVAEAQAEVPASEMKIPAVTDLLMPQEVPGAAEPPKAHDVDMEIKGTDNPSSADAVIHKEHVSAIAEDQNTSLSRGTQMDNPL